MKKRRRSAALLALTSAMALAATSVVTLVPGTATAACGHLGNHKILVVGAARARIVNGPSFSGWVNSFYGGTADEPNFGWLTPAGYLQPTGDYHTTSVSVQVSDNSTTHCTIGRVEYTLVAWPDPVCVIGGSPVLQPSGIWTTSLSYNTCTIGDSYFRLQELLSHIWVSRTKYFQVLIKQFNASGTLISQDNGCYKIDATATDCNNSPLDM